MTLLSSSCGHRFSPSEGGREATTGNASAVRRLLVPAHKQHTVPLTEGGRWPLSLSSRRLEMLSGRRLVATKWTEVQLYQLF